MKSLLELRKSRNLTQRDMAEILGVSRQAYANYESGNREPDISSLRALSDFFEVSIDYLVGQAECKAPSQQIDVLNRHNVYMVPVYVNAAAGFGALALDEVVDHTPLFISYPSEASETICIKVTGDSMYPKIENGDIVQVHKQTSVDSGSVAVVLLDGDEGLVKKIVYGPDWIQLQSINPMYPPMIFEGPEVERIQVVGLVKKVIKEI